MMSVEYFIKRLGSSAKMSRKKPPVGVVGVSGDVLCRLFKPLSCASLFAEGFGDLHDELEG